MKILRETKRFIYAVRKDGKKLIILKNKIRGEVMTNIISTIEQRKVSSNEKSFFVPLAKDLTEKEKTEIKKSYPEYEIRIGYNYENEIKLQGLMFNKK